MKINDSEKLNFRDFFFVEFISEKFSEIDDFVDPVVVRSDASVDVGLTHTTGHTPRNYADQNPVFTYQRSARVAQTWKSGLFLMRKLRNHEIYSQAPPVSLACAQSDVLKTFAAFGVDRRFRHSSRPTTSTSMYWRFEAAFPG